MKLFVPVAFLLTPLLGQIYFDICEKEVSDSKSYLKEGSLEKTLVACDLDYVLVDSDISDPETYYCVNQDISSFLQDCQKRGADILFVTSRPRPYTDSPHHQEDQDAHEKTVRYIERRSLKSTVFVNNEESSDYFFDNGILYCLLNDSVVDKGRSLSAFLKDEDLDYSNLIFLDDCLVNCYSVIICNFLQEHFENLFVVNYIKLIFSNVLKKTRFDNWVNHCVLLKLELRRQGYLQAVSEICRFFLVN